MVNIEFKENAWKYNDTEKLEIVFIGMSGVIRNVCRNFNISTPTYYRWKSKYISNASRIFRDKSFVKAKNKKQEALSSELAAKCKLLSMIPADIVQKLKSSAEYKSFFVETIKASQCVPIKALCKSIGFSANTYYKYRSRELADARIRFPALVALDFFIDSKHMDKDSLALKMVCAGIPITGKEAGNLRWQALSYIKRHRLFKNPAVYEFLNADDAWCMDFMQFYDAEDRVKYHLKIIDDRSRMDVANAVLERATTDAAFEVLEQAIKSTGRKPSAIKTDRGTQFKVRFGNYLKEKGIAHLKSYPNMPEFNAKIERRFKDVRLFNLANPKLDLENMIIVESNLHNYVRKHESLSGYTPSDVYWKGKDPPFNHPDSKIESVTKWHTRANENLKVIISN